MFTYDLHPGDARLHFNWVLPGTPRAVDADGTTVLMIGRDGERADFICQMPGLVDQVEFSAERDAAAATLHVRVGPVFVPGNNSGLTLSGTDAAFRQRVHGVFERAVASWPELGWADHRSVFYD
ncbi:MAG: hypothetical protein AB7O88_25465 [Reyranellaceae bacterium]